MLLITSAGTQMSWEEQAFFSAPTSPIDRACIPRTRPCDRAVLQEERGPGGACHLD